MGLPERRQEISGILRGKTEEFAKALPARIDPERFVRAGLTAVVHNPKILKCSDESIYLALLDSARTGLIPDGTEAALIPYGDTCEFQEMWQGIARLMKRHGDARKVEARIVKDGDDFDFRFGLEPDLEHKPAPSSDRGETTYAYAIAWMDDGDTIFEVIDREELDTIQAQADKKSPAWRNFPDEMRRKAAVKRLGKYLDLAPEAQAAIDLDHAKEVGDREREREARGRTRSLAEGVLEEDAQDKAADLRSRLDKAQGGEGENGDEDLRPEDLPWKQLEGAPEGWEVAHRGNGKHLLRNPDGVIVNSPETLVTEDGALAEVERLLEKREEEGVTYLERLDSIRQDRGWSWADVGEKAMDVLDLDEPKSKNEFTRGELSALIAEWEPVNQ